VPRFLRGARAQAVGLRARTEPAVDRAAIAVGRLLTRVAADFLLYPHRDERVPLPRSTEVEGRSFDVVADLVDYTGLTREQVEALVHRRHETFRGEWHALPSALQNETWYYLASRTYLFANSVHDPLPVLDEVAAYASPPGVVLDFGGGTGNLALALAAKGHRVDYLEVSALQKDFVRFRVAKYDLGERVRVLDRWKRLRRDAYGLVCAFDVLEHLPDLASVLERDLLPALTKHGILAECSPFVRNLSNPMHHEDEAEFDAFLHERGFRVLQQGPELRLWVRAYDG
jgi:SAM-dependent methyltransferase